MGAWNISRNLNIIRQQLKLIFTQLDKETQQQFQQNLIRDELAQFFQKQQDDDNDDVINISTTKLHRRVTMHDRAIEKDAEESQLWHDEISEINKDIPDHYHYDCRQLSLTTQGQIAYFIKFVKYCINSTQETLNEKKSSFMNDSRESYDNYYKHFLDSWLRKPKWYSIDHDILLLRLALMFNLNEKEYISELNGLNSADYQQVLQSSDYYDRDKPFHEFSSWCQRWENIHHRLRYLTHCIVLELSKCKPSIIDKRIPQKTDRPFSIDQQLNSVIFLDSLMYQTHLKYCRDEKESLKRDRDSEFSKNGQESYNILPVSRKRDPFINRSLQFEFKEILYAFDLYKHGKIMAQFIIDRLEMKQRKSLWILLGTLLKRMPYHMSLQILTKNRELLRRGTPSSFDQVCQQVIEGSNFSVPVALYISSLMEVNAEEDLARHIEWRKYSEKYEQLAASKINTVESDHVISILLDARIFMDEEGLLELALESRRLRFLNSETVNGVISHMWQTVDFSNPHTNPSFKPGPMNHWQLFQLLLFKPFYFYLSPLGFSWTISVLFVIYCIIIGIYLNLGIHQTDIIPDISTWQGIFEIIVWTCGGGYIAHEIKEYLDQGTTYFSVNLSNNSWDIVLSINFMILFILRILGGYFKIYNDASQKAYDILWALQCVILAIRALRLLQTSTYLGPLLHVIGLMVGQLIRFLVIILVTCIGFVIGVMYISDGDIIDHQQFETMYDTTEYLFQSALGITDLSIYDSFGRNQLMAQLYNVFFIIVSSILLLNLLIALMTTEFDAVRELAKEESAYLKAQYCYDLKHRSRYIPPPINWILAIILLLIHIINIIPALISPNYLNIYAHLHRPWMNPLRSHCYRHYHHPHDRPKQQHKHKKEHNKLIEKQQFEEWDESNKNIMNTRLKVLDYYWKSLFYAWAAQSCCKSVNIQDWKIYHVNCYNIISNGTNDIRKWNVISINEYFKVYEKCTQTTLDPYDKNLVAHLTSNSCVFCKYCNRSITTSPKHLKSQALTPFWVMADIISCWCFLIVLYLPMIIIMFFIGFFEQIIFGNINDHHIMSTDDDDDFFDDIFIEQLKNKQNDQNQQRRRSRRSQRVQASYYKTLNAKKKRRMRDYGKQYYRKTATHHDVFNTF